MIINIFCDASIDLNTHIACGGCYITYQDNISNEMPKELTHRLIIQQEATNNSSEILAIWAGVVEALKLKEQYPNAIYRLFSDSKISLYGLRDWMKNWISYMNNYILTSSSGKPVMNQQRFIEIYNLIVENNLKIEFYHQRGHVKDGKVTLDRARAQFIKANKVPPEGLGLDMVYLSFCNDIIDRLTRKAVKEYTNNDILISNTDIELVQPMIYHVRDHLLPNYIRCINKTSINSRHDFKGGYNQ